MRYACLDGGKRFRAMLVYACGELAGASAEVLDVPASAIEMVHAYSLVHDDLPAMDDDALRRGRPTCHIAFDDATAVLAGDALQSLAFEVLAADGALAVTPARRMEMVRVLAAACGEAGMAGGQALDIDASGRTLMVEELRDIHRRKTGALIRAAAALGVLAGRGDEAMLRALDRYAAAVGLAYQVVDDILDETEDSDTLGKDSGSDREMDKVTYTRLLGVEGARKTAATLHRQALASLAELEDNAWFLRKLADFVLNRTS